MVLKTISFLSMFRKSFVSLQKSSWGREVKVGFLLNPNGQKIEFQKTTLKYNNYEEKKSISAT